MSISDFFGRKTRALAAAFAIAAGAGGGAYVAHERTQPTESQFTLASAQHMKGGMNEDTLLNGRLPLFASMPEAAQKARKNTLRDMTRQIDAMERMKGAPDPETAGALQASAISFVNTLRLSENLTERDYAKLLKDYNARVGLDVTAQAGNYTAGVKYAQECNFATAVAEMWGFDDEETPPAERAQDIGKCMTDDAAAIQEYAQEADAKDGMKSELGGAAGGAALGGFALLPFLRRRKSPPVQKGFRGT